MPVNIKPVELAPARMQQFQADTQFELDQRSPAMQVMTNQNEPTLDTDDISLAMRQFFQSPIRTAG